MTSKMKTPRGPAQHISGTRVKAPKTGMQGDTPVSVLKMKMGGTRNSIRNMYPADEGRGFTGHPKADKNENLKSRKDTVKVVVWNPSQTLKKTGKVKIPSVKIIPDKGK